MEKIDRTVLTEEGIDDIEDFVSYGKAPCKQNLENQALKNAYRNYIIEEIIGRKS